MMSLLLALPLALLALQDDGAREIRELIRKLGSEKIDERGRAEQKLINLGPRALEALKRAHAGTDLEVRERLRGVIYEIERRGRLRRVMPGIEPLDLDLKNVTVEAAAEALFDRIGIKAEIHPSNEDFGIRAMDLKLRGAGLWEAFDAFCAQAGVGPGFLFPFAGSPSSVRFTPAGVRGPSYRWDTLGDIRVYARPALVKDLGPHRGDPSIEFSVVFPSTAFVTAVRIENVKVGGHALGQVGKGALWFPRVRLRKWGRLIIHMPEGRRVVKRRWLDGAETMSVQGTVSVSHPRDVEVFELSPDALQEALTTEVEGCKVTLSSTWIGESLFESAFSWTSKEGAPDHTFLVWREDKGGRFLKDLEIISTRAGKAGIKRWWSKETKVVVARVIGEQWVRSHFKIEALPVPRIPGK